MASITARRNLEKIAERICKGTHFTKPEVKSLLDLFNKEAKNEKMDRQSFRDFLYKNFRLTDDILLDGVFRAFDQDNDSNVNMEEWVYGLSVFLRGSLGEQILFCFVVYDLNGDGFISREEIHPLLKNCMVRMRSTYNFSFQHQYISKKTDVEIWARDQTELNESGSEEDTEENVKELEDIVVKKMDIDRDGKLSLDDFREAVKRDYLLLEVFGRCLPECRDIEKFSEYFA